MQIYLTTDVLGGEGRSSIRGDLLTANFRAFDIANSNVRSWDGRVQEVERIRSSRTNHDRSGHPKSWLIDSATKV